MFKKSCSLALLFCFSCVQAQTNSSYALRQVTMPPGATGIANLISLDAKGEVVGNLKKGTQTFPARWTNSAVTPFTSPFGNGQPKSITAASRAGAAAGSGTDASGKPVNVYWDSSGRATVLAKASVPDNPCCIYVVSDNGVIGGTVGVVRSQAAIWSSPSAIPQILPVIYSADCSIGDNCFSFVTAISPDGRYVVGYYDDYLHGPDNAILWIDGVASAGGYGSGFEEFAAAVNNSGVIVGYYGNDPNEEPWFSPPHAFRDTVHGGLVDLGTLPGGAISYANSINASGTIVGSATVAGDTYIEHPHAVMWVNDSIIDLQAALAGQLPANVELNAAQDINDAGQILLTGQNVQTGAAVDFIATPLIATEIAVSSNINPSSYGQQIHLVATIKPASGPVPLGQVSWYDNGKLLGTAGLTKIGTASWEPSTWTPGVHNITVSYAGHAPDAGSTSSAFRQTVVASSTKTTLSASANPATAGKALTLTATVVPTYGTITGTVTFRSGTAILGTANVDGRTKQASWTTTFASAGKYPLTAAYAGSINFVPTSSPALSLTVE